MVDENGKTVDTPPQYIQDPSTGKYYFFVGGEKDQHHKSIASGDFKSAESLGLLQEAEGYKPSTQGMKIYSGQDGSIKVVDENGKTVDTPPQYIQDPSTGKYYFFVGGEKDQHHKTITSGDFKSAESLGLLQEVEKYKPSWWGKKPAD